jgi:hypothetical protein
VAIFVFIGSIVTAEGFKVMIGFLRDEKLVVNNGIDLDLMVSVLKLADRHGLPQLTAIVSQRLESLVTVDNIEVFGQMAFEYHLNGLTAAVKTYVDNNLDHLLKKSHKELDRMNRTLNGILVEAMTKRLDQYIRRDQGVHKTSSQVSRTESQISELDPRYLGLDPMTQSTHIHFIE